MKYVLATLAVIFAPIVLVAAIYFGTLNGLVRKQENVPAAQNEVFNCYQKRFDLVDNLANTVKGAAENEQSITVGYAEARAAVPKLPANPTDADREKFAEAQKAAATALSKFVATAEAVPHIKSNANFIRFQKDLKDIEQQCALKRTRYNEVVRALNTAVRTFPSSIVASMNDIKAAKYFEFPDSAAIQSSPRVNFKK